jgi:hypothetical protein
MSSAPAPGPTFNQGSLKRKNQRQAHIQPSKSRRPISYESWSAGSLNLGQVKFGFGWRLAEFVTPT